MTASSIRPIHFARTDGHAGDIEVTSMAAIRQRVLEEADTPQRPHFHLLFVVREGGANHRVDFVDYPLSPGVALWVRAGQVQQWGQIADFEADIVLFQPTALLTTDGGPLSQSGFRRRGYWRLTADTSEPVDSGLHYLRKISGLAADYALTSLLVTLAGLPDESGDLVPGGVTESNHIFDLLREAVDTDHHRTRTVADYARALGYSEKTLTRASRAATGLSAKQFIDERVILEAKRLLAHSNLSVTAVAAALGFDDTANFSKYFSTRTGVLPKAFRASSRTPS